MSVHKKILEAQKAIGYVAKNGKNTFHKYDYAMEADILDTVKTAANDAGLIILTKTSSEIGQFQNEKQETIRWAKVTLSFAVVDPEDDSVVEGAFDGYAEDKGDKAIYKATTGANKYFLMKFFGVATGDDPERDEQPTKARQQESKPLPTQAGEPATGPVSAIDYKNTIQGLMTKHDLSPKTVADVTGVPNWRQCNDAAILKAASVKLFDYVSHPNSQAG